MDAQEDSCSSVRLIAHATRPSNRPRCLQPRPCLVLLFPMEKTIIPFGRRQRQEHYLFPVAFPAVARKLKSNGNGNASQVEERAKRRW